MCRKKSLKVISRELLLEILVYISHWAEKKWFIKVKSNLCLHSAKGERDKTYKKWQILNYFHSSTHETWGWLTSHEVFTPNKTVVRAELKCHWL